MSEEGKDHHGHHHHHHHHHHGDEEQQRPSPPPPQYGTFQGVANHPPQPVYGFPQPVPPPGLHGYQAVTGYAVAEGRPVIRERRLPCCGIGLGWFLFIIGFFLAAVPWYLGAFVLLCARFDHREKPGYVACMIAASSGMVTPIFHEKHLRIKLLLGIYLMGAIITAMATKFFAMKFAILGTFALVFGLTKNDW